MIHVHLKEPLKQKDWGWPAIANFSLGSTGAGLYLVNFFLIFLKTDSDFFNQRISFGFIPLLLIIFGFLCLSIETGRPLRSFYLFGRPSQSWISLETMAGCMFIAAAICDYFFPHPILKLITIMSALAFLISQGLIVFRARAIIAWNMPIIPIVFVSSGLASGYGLFVMLVAADTIGPDKTTLLLGLILLLFNMVIWLIYLRQAAVNDFTIETKGLRQPFFLTITIGFGQIFPLFLLLFLLLPKHTIGLVPLSLSITLCGILLLIGNISQKVGIIFSAGYFRGIELKG